MGTLTFKSLLTLLTPFIQTQRGKIGKITEVIIRIFNEIYQTREN